MPKKEIILKSETRIESELRDFLSSLFEERELFRLERLGGRVSISLSAPYTPQSDVSNSPQVSSDIIEKLKLADSNEEREVYLDTYDKKGLSEIGRKLDIRFGSKTTKAELKQLITQTVRDMSVMSKIANPTRDSDSSASSSEDSTKNKPSKET